MNRRSFLKIAITPAGALIPNKTMNEQIGASQKNNLPFLEKIKDLNGKEALEVLEKDLQKEKVLEDVVSLFTEVYEKKYTENGAKISNISVSCIDVENGSKFGFGEDEHFYAASVPKLHIMASVYEKIGEEEISLDDVIKIEKPYLREADSKEALLKEGYDWNYKEGDRISVKEALKYVATYSNNTSANLLARLVGPESMDKLTGKYDWSPLNRLYIGGDKDKLEEERWKEEGKGQSNKSSDFSELLFLLSQNKLGKNHNEDFLKLLSQNDTRDYNKISLPDEAFVIARKDGWYDQEQNSKEEKTETTHRTVSYIFEKNAKKYIVSINITTNKKKGENETELQKNIPLPMKELTNQIHQILLTEKE